ncbi:hypothetical protein C8D87_11459 [Lentzea atacamensis]|uniref:Peptidase inhibitor family I36 n=1 Tax=Lentzea atacamensis TaxID=531938 RepID=A0ABX9DZ06_9PSEU|nr:DUF6355 family natural product biosynthesis protein [Lentzea atacamensis]RAS59447.1 hypothetical protein C8D87_11459 [Lentzea atacamensis]
MTRSYIGRVVGAFVVAAGMLLGLFAATASAQVVDHAPAAQIQAAGADAKGAALAGSASSASVGAAYYQCGYYRNPYQGWDAYYTHCGRSTYPRIRVQFNYGWTHRDITVLGTVNLSRHRDLQGAGVITNAWCIRDCW